MRIYGTVDATAEEKENPELEIVWFFFDIMNVYAL